jgi:lipoprotein-releasing system permease protein
LNLPFFIARRYLFSKRKKNFIHHISGISVFLVAGITASIIVVLSVFNGLERLLFSLNNSFDPEIKIEATKGKSFHATDSLLKVISAVPGVEVVTQVIEDYAYVRYNDANQVVTMKAVSDNFIQQNRIPKENIIEGELKLNAKGIHYAVVGSGIRNSLGLAAHDAMYAIQFFYIKNTRSLDPSQMYSRKNILPAGVFSIMQNLDDNYVIVPLDFGIDLLDYGDKRTSIEIKSSPGFTIEQVQTSLRSALGDKFTVLNHEEQHKDLYKLLKMEKLFAFLSLTILLAIGSINIFFSLMMLALDKKKDISVLSALGANEKLIRDIFLIEGILIAMGGTIIGLIAGWVLCWAQGEFGMVSMGMESSVTPGYPVHMLFNDFLATLVAMLVITLGLSVRPARMAAKFVSVQHL